MSAFLDALTRVPALLASHVLLSAAALLLGIAISLPLGIWSARNATVARVSLGFASLVQTIPSLALLALFYPVLLSLSALVGGGIPALGFLPSLIALTLYALLPIMRNTVTGLAEVPQGLRQAGTALGMTSAQRMRLVQLPIAMPTLLAGVRTATTIAIGTATIAAFIGAGGFGERIVTGLALNDRQLLLAGALPAAAHALVSELLFEAIDRLLLHRPG